MENNDEKIPMRWLSSEDKKPIITSTGGEFPIEEMRKVFGELFFGPGPIEAQKQKVIDKWLKVFPDSSEMLPDYWDEQEKKG